MRSLRLHDESAPTRCGSCAQPVGAWATDRLTGLLGRWGWDDQAPATYRRAQRRWEQVALLMIDLDRFKKINDEYGHPAGDVVLSDVAAVLTAHTRPTDLVCRYGGDEFLVLLPRTTGGEAAIVAERILRGIRALQTEITTNDGYHLTLHGQTASIGVAAHVPRTRGHADRPGPRHRRGPATGQASGRARVQVHDPSAFAAERAADSSALHHLLALQDLMSSDQLPQVLVALSDGAKAADDLVPALGPKVHPDAGTSAGQRLRAPPRGPLRTHGRRSRVDHGRAAGRRRVDEPPSSPERRVSGLTSSSSQ